MNTLVKILIIVSIVSLLSGCVSVKIGPDIVKDIESIPTVEKVVKWFYTSGSWDNYTITAEILLKNGKYIYLEEVNYEKEELKFKYLMYIYNIQIWHYVYDVKKSKNGREYKIYNNATGSSPYFEYFDRVKELKVTEIVKDRRVKDLLLNTDQVYNEFSKLPIEKSFGFNDTGLDPDVFSKLLGEYVEKLPGITFTVDNSYYKVFRNELPDRWKSHPHVYFDQL